MKVLFFVNENKNSLKWKDVDNIKCQMPQTEHDALLCSFIKQ